MPHRKSIKKPETTVNLEAYKKMHDKKVCTRYRKKFLVPQNGKGRKPTSFLKQFEEVSDDTSEDRFESDSSDNNEAVIIKAL